MYVPKVGELVKLKTFSDYCQQTPRLQPWARLRVEAILHGLRVRVQVMNGNEPVEGDNERIFPIDRIDPPLGWEQVYTVYVNDLKQRDQLLGWIEDGRGVACWISHDLSCAGRRSWTPGDSGSPHWQFTANPIEIIHDPARFKFILCESSDTKPSKEELKKIVEIDHSFVKLWSYNRRDRRWYKEQPI